MYLQVLISRTILLLWAVACAFGYCWKWIIKISVTLLDRRRRERLEDFQTAYLLSSWGAQLVFFTHKNWPTKQSSCISRIIIIIPIRAASLFTLFSHFFCVRLCSFYIPRVGINLPTAQMLHICVHWRWEYEKKETKGMNGRKKERKQVPN